MPTLDPKVYEYELHSAFWGLVNYPPVWHNLIPRLFLVSYDRLTGLSDGDHLLSLGGCLFGSDVLAIFGFQEFKVLLLLVRINCDFGHGLESF